MTLDHGYTQAPVTVTVILDVMTADGGPSPMLANSTDPAAIHDGITVIDDLLITASRPHPLAHQSPGGLTCTLLVPPDHTWRLPWGRRIIVETALPNLPTQRIGYCWVTHWTREWVDALDCWRYSITAADIIGVLAGHMVGDTPWPQEALDVRVARINNLSAIGPMLPPQTGNKTLVPARDVDNRPLLELAHLMIPPASVSIEWDQNAGGTSAGRSMRSTRAVGRLTTWPTTSKAGYIAISELPPHPLAAGAIERVPVAGDRTASIGQISITDPVDVGGGVLEPATVTYKTTGLPYTTSALTFETDLPPAAYGGSVVPFVRSVLAFNRLPAEIMTQPCRIVQPRRSWLPWQVPGPGQLANNLNLLTGVRYRTRRPIRIIDCPPDLEPLQIIIGITITIRRGRMSLAVTMVPARLAGAAAIRYGDVPAAGTPAPGVPVTFTNAGTAYDVPAPGPVKWQHYDFNRTA